MSIRIFLCRAFVFLLLVLSLNGCLTTLVYEELKSNSTNLESLEVKGATSTGSILTAVRYSELRWWTLEIYRNAYDPHNWDVKIADAATKVDQQVPLPAQVSLWKGKIQIVEPGQNPSLLFVPEVPPSAFRYVEGAVLMPVTVAVDVVTAPLWVPLLIFFWPKC